MTILEEEVYLLDDRIYENHDTYSDTKSYLDPNLNLDIEKLSQAVYRYGRSFIISRGNKKDRLSVEAEFDENIGFTDVKIKQRKSGGQTREGTIKNCKSKS